MSLTTALHINTTQHEAFTKNGFLKIEKALPGPFITELRNSIDILCNNYQQLTDMAVQTDANGKVYIVGINHLLTKPDNIFAALLGSPLMLSVAAALCGNDFFPVQDFAVIKTLGDNSTVGWHQDVITTPLSKAIMIGIYLDAADEQNGALRIVPGTHLKGHDICKLQELPFTSITMEPGDMLVHDLMVAHSSGMLTSQQQRRVVYFEFMSSQQVLEEEVYEPDFVTLRTSLIPVAMQLFQNAYPQATPFDWQHPEKSKHPIPDDAVAAIATIYATNKKVKPANYCFDF